MLQAGGHRAGQQRNDGLLPLSAQRLWCKHAHTCGAFAKHDASTCRLHGPLQTPLHSKCKHVHYHTGRLPT